jgi:hypothetical protein
MKNTLMIALACAVGLATSARTADALALTNTLGDPYFLGTVVDGIPSDLTSEANYINSLLDMSVGELAKPCPRDTDEQCDRVNSTLDVSGFDAGDDATAVNAVKVDADLSKGVPNPAFDNDAIDVTGYTYLIAKYDAEQAGSLVWYVGTLTGLVSVPDSFNGKGISHYSLYGTPDNPPPPDTSTPDGGTTLMLLGFAMVGLGALRSKMKQ